jgi:hypothetical protein
VISFIAVARRMKTFAYSSSDLLEISGGGEITSVEVEEVWALIKRVDPGYSDRRRLKPPTVMKFCEEAAKSFNLLGVEEIGRRGIVVNDVPKISKAVHTPEFLKEVDSLLPAQPWRSGIHAEIAEKLNCESRKVAQAIGQLMEEGKWKYQKDGVLYESKDQIF